VIFTGPKALQMQPTAPQPTVPATPQLRMAPQAVPAQPQRVTPQPQRVN